MPMASGPLGVAGGGEDRPRVALEHFQPGADIGGVSGRVSGVMPRSAHRYASPISATSSSIAYPASPNRFRQSPRVSSCTGSPTTFPHRSWKSRARPLSRSKARCGWSVIRACTRVVETARAAEAAMRREWCEKRPEDLVDRGGDAASCASSGCSNSCGRDQPTFPSSVAPCHRQARGVLLSIWANPPVDGKVTMSQIQHARGRPGHLASYLRPLAIAASWLALVALASGCFFAPRGAEVQPTIDDVVGFGCSMAIAGAAAATAVFGIGGRSRWAVELTLSVAILSSVSALLLIYLLWFDPTFVREHMDLWSFQRLQDGGCSWAEQLAGYHGPLGATVGIVVGSAAVLLARLGRHRPRLATGAALIVLVAIASGPGSTICLRSGDLAGLHPPPPLRAREHFRRSDIDHGHDLRRDSRRRDREPRDVCDAYAGRCDHGRSSPGSRITDSSRLKICSPG